MRVRSPRACQSYNSQVERQGPKIETSVEESGFLRAMVLGRDVKSSESGGRSIGSSRRDTTLGNAVTCTVAMTALLSALIALISVVDE